MEEKPEKTATKKAVKKTATTKRATKKTLPKVAASDFSAHLERIRRAKAEADAVAPNEPLDARDASIALLWEIVFDTLCNSSELCVSDFNTVAGIIQKLASAKVAGRAENAPQPSADLSEETLSKIESQLKMM